MENAGEYLRCHFLASGGDNKQTLLARMCIINGINPDLVVNESHYRNKHESTIDLIRNRGGGGRR